MAAAAGYKLFQLLKDPVSSDMLKDNLILLVTGNVVAFIVAIFAIRFFIDFLTRYGFKTFGIYRIIVGSLLLALIFSGADLSI
jgi:undecaprenyl-diphosphatase